MKQLNTLPNLCCAYKGWCSRNKQFCALWNIVLQSRCSSFSTLYNKSKMPLELGLSEGLCYLGLSWDYSLQSYLSLAPMAECAHTSAPSLGWLPSVLSHWPRMYGFRLLPDLCFFPVHLLNHPLCQPEAIVHSSCFAGKAPRQGLCSGVCCWVLAAFREHSAACTGHWCSHTVLLWKE